MIAVEVAGITALAGLLIFLRKKRLGNLLAIVTLAVSMIGGGLMTWTANLGGQIRHTEIRSGVDSPSESEKDRSGRSGNAEKEDEDE